MGYSWRVATALTATLAILVVGVVTPAHAGSAVNIDGMNQAIMDLLREVANLEQEVQQLRGDVEVQGHTLEAVQARQRELSQGLGMRPAAPAGAAMAPSPALSTVTPPAMPTAIPAAPVVLAPSPSVPPVAPVQPTVVPVAPQVAPVASSAGEQTDYDNAFSLLRSGGYEEAVKAFRAFLAQYPKSQLAANSQYWIGEAYYTTRRFKEAMPEFQQVVDNYPTSGKTADALLKLGYINDDSNKSAEAKKLLEAVIARFPQSTAAQLAAKRLAKMRH